MSSLQDCLSNCQKLSQCHQILSSKNCHQKLSSKNCHQKIVIKNCHQKLSPKIVIKNFHKSLGSPCSVVKTLIVSGNRATNQGTRSPIELFWTAIKRRIMICHKKREKTGQDDGLQDLPRPKLLAGLDRLCKGLRSSEETRFC